MACKFRGAFFEKGAHAFLLVGSSKGERKKTAFQYAGIAKIEVVAALRSLLRKPHRHGAFGGDRSRHLQALVCFLLLGV